MDFTGFMGGGGGYSGSSSAASDGTQGGASFVGGSLNKAAPASNSNMQLIMVGAIALALIIAFKK